ncbi:O-antigen ligase family protein [Pseudomonas tolaasii]|uniref:O-antigen ligase family protein n=1 Tax=Pseudomonas tolaasii TaxID=29442 RepID=UPI0030D453C5
MTNHDGVKNSVAITAATLVAIFFMQDQGALFYLAIIGSALLVLTAIMSPWLGLLALFPLAFALRPAPPSVGIQEMAFAALLMVVFLSALIKLLRAQGFKSAIRLFAAPLLVGMGFLLLNFAIAMHQHIPLADWIRGVVPFLFIYTLIPVCTLVGREEGNIRWLGVSMGTLILLTAGYIVFYYFYHDLWHAYWTVMVNGETVRIHQEEALRNAQALGPMRDRITMVVAQATDAILPLGMVAGYVVSTCTPKRKMVLAGSFLSLLCMAAVLITFTRSMLISGLFVIGLFSLYTFFTRKHLRLKVLSSLVVQGVFAIAFIFGTGMQDVWLGRLNQLTQTALPIATSSIESIATINTQSDTAKPASSSNTNAKETAPQKAADKPQAADRKEQEKEREPEKVKEKEKEKEKEKDKDFNVSSRVEEYKIAWDMFKNHPVFGNGIGVKHEMRWETSTGHSFTESVGYIHNWPLYTLMVGGVLGLLIYALILGAPILYRLTAIKSEPTHFAVIRTAVMTLAIYGLFFAVFRLISFNLLLAAAWGVMLAHQHSRREMKTAPTSADTAHVPTATATTRTLVTDNKETSV